MKKIALSLLLPLLMGNLYAQNKTCDLSIALQPNGDSVTIPYGDSLNLYITIKNNGPDTIQPEDTINYEIIGLPGIFINHNNLIAPGDSVSHLSLTAWADQGSVQDEIDTICAQLLPSNHITDNQPNNDEACGIFTLKGLGTTGIGSLNPSGAITVYPNPVKGNQMTLKLPDGAPAGVPAVMMTDVLGRNIPLKITQLDDHQFSLTFEPVPDGMYFIRYQEGAFNLFKKILIQNP